MVPLQNEARLQDLWQGNDTFEINIEGMYFHSIEILIHNDYYNFSFCSQYFSSPKPPTLGSTCSSPVQYYTASGLYYRSVQSVHFVTWWCCF